MHDHLRRLLAVRLSPAVTAHAWFDDDAAAGGGGSTPPAGDGGAPPAAATGATNGEPAGGDGGATPDLSALQKELREARREAASFRTELKKYQDADQAAKQAQMSEQEKLQAQLAELQRGITERDERIRAMDLKQAVQRSASKLGFADPEDAMRLLDAQSIEYADDGRPRNLDHLLGELIRAKPYLRASFTQPPDLGQGDRGRPAGTLTRSQLEKMTEAEIMALPPAEIDAALARP